MMKKVIVKKGEVLQRSGEVNTKVFHVKSGLLRSYCLDYKGKEHIFMFAPEGWTIADAIPAEQPSDLYIEALEDSEVVILPKDVERENHNAATLIKRLYVLQKRVIMLMSSPAIERYEHFMRTYPDVAQRVPQKMIASYLGITPEALSKVKNARRKS